MPDQTVLREPTDAEKIAAAKNEWGKTFTLGEGEAKREFEIKDLGYFDYIEFVGLVKPLITVAANALEMGAKDGEMKVDFNPAALDFDAIFKLCGKELPKMAGIICRQTEPKITDRQVAELAKRPQRLVEVVLLQVMHNKMIEEFGGFFQRLTAMVTSLMPDMTKIAAPSEIATDSTTEETLS